MLKVNELVDALVTESATRKVIGKAPASTGVPEICPVLELSERPIGRVPDVIENDEL